MPSTWMQVHRLRGAGSIAVGLLLAWPAFAQAPAQKSAPWLETPIGAEQHDVTLADMLDAVTKGAGGSFVADGAPKKTTGDLRAHGAARTALDSIAKSFDVEWRISHGGVALVSRRCEDPSDWPQARPAELYQMAREEIRILSFSGCDPTEDPANTLYQKLISSITPEQATTLHSGGRVAFGELLPQQQILLRQAIVNNNFSTYLAACRDLYTCMKSLPKSEVRITRAAAGAVERLDLVWPTNTHWPQSIQIAPTSGLTHAVPGGRSNPPPTVLGTGGPVTAADSPPSDEEAALARPCSVHPAATTLGHVASELSRQTGQKIETADYLTDRAILVGGRPCSARSLLDAIAELLELRLVRTGPNQYQLARRAVTVPRTLGEYPIALRALFPPDLRAYLGMDVRPAEAYHYVADYRNGDQRLQREDSDIVLHTVFRERTGSAGSRAAQELSASLVDVKEPSLAFSRLTAKQQELATLILVLSSLHGIKQGLLYKSNEPPHMTHPEAAMIELRGNNYLRIFSEVRNGDQVTGNGFGIYLNPNAQPPPKP